MTRVELSKELDKIQSDLWAVVRKHSLQDNINDFVIEEIAIFLLLKIKPTWEE